jgi:hypothetical protein
MVNRKEITVPDFYTTYINALQEDNLQEALANNTRRFRKLLKHNTPQEDQLCVCGRQMDHQRTCCSTSLIPNGYLSIARSLLPGRTRALTRL